MERIHFGAAVRFIFRDEAGEERPVEGVFIGFDATRPGWGLVVPNDHPGGRYAVPMDDLEPLED